MCVCVRLSICVYKNVGICLSERERERFVCQRKCISVRNELHQDIVITRWVMRYYYYCCYTPCALVPLTEVDHYGGVHAKPASQRVQAFPACTTRLWTKGLQVQLKTCILRCLRFHAAWTATVTKYQKLLMKQAGRKCRSSLRSVCRGLFLSMSLVLALVNAYTHTH
jgi:hypothetical protein